jgi:hypothetical protein
VIDRVLEGPLDSAPRVLFDSSSPRRRPGPSKIRIAARGVKNWIPAFAGMTMGFDHMAQNEAAGSEKPSSMRRTTPLSMRAGTQDVLDVDRIELVGAITKVAANFDIAALGNDGTDLVGAE